MASQAGIAPADNLPSGLRAFPVVVGEPASTYDGAYDLERMLGVLRPLPGLHGLRPAAADYLGANAEPIEITIELELETDAPHIDLVRQLGRLIERVVEQRGVVVGRAVLELLERIAAQARRAWLAHQVSRGP